MGSQQRLDTSIRLTASDSSQACGGGVTVASYDGTASIEGEPVTGYVDCLDDNPVSIPMSGIGAAGANVVDLRVDPGTGKVRVRVTSTDGAAQAVPCDPVAHVESDTVPITAIDVTRVPGSVDTPRVKYTLAKIAS